MVEFNIVDELEVRMSEFVEQHQSSIKSFLESWYRNINTAGTELPSGPMFVICGHKVRALRIAGDIIEMEYHPFITPWLNRRKYRVMRLKYNRMKGKPRNKKR